MRHYGQNHGAQILRQLPLSCHSALQTFELSSANINNASRPVKSQTSSLNSGTDKVQLCERCIDKLTPLPLRRLAP